MIRTAPVLLLTSALATSAFALNAAAATVSVEIATADRVQSTAPRAWLQLLTQAGVTNVRIRGGQAGDEPEINTLGPQHYQVVGILSASNKLRLPGGTFGRRDAARLRDYFDRLRADGPERQTAETGKFGLTREEFEAVFRDLGGPTLFSTAELPLNQILAKASKTLRHKIVYQPPKVQEEKPSGDELSDLTIGATLAIALRREGLVLFPEKPRGKPIQYRVAPLDLAAKKSKAKQESWPVGYKPEARPREVAPAIMGFTNVEIDGYKLSEVIDVIAPRLKVPVLWDTAALAHHQIDPAKIDVKLPPSRTYYKRILDRLLNQDRLKGELRVDEAGTAFYWITR